MRMAAFIALLPIVSIGLAAPSSGKERKARDPNQIVCENEEVLGSRLARRRVCMTRAQWADRQRDDRAIVNRSQTQLCVPQGGQCTGAQ